MKKDWEVKRFEDVFFLKMGKTPSRDNSCYWNGDYKWATISDINGSKYIYNTKEKISSEAISDNNMTLISEGTVIMSFKLSIGKVAIVGENMYSNEAIMAFIPKTNNVISDYIYYYIKGHKWTGGNKAVMGITLNKKSLSRNTFLIPPLQTQQQIVDELDSITSIIEKHKKQLEELDTLAQSIFYDMFGDPITNEKGWKKSSFGREFKISSGGTPNTKNQDYWNNGDISWIGSNLCQNSILYENDGKYITEKGLLNSSAKLYNSGCVLVALVGATIGKVALLKFTTTTNQNIAGIEVNSNLQHTPEFIFYLLQALYPLFLQVGGDKFKMANLSFIRDLPLFSPPLSLQQQFASKIEAIEKQKELIKQSLSEVQQLFDSRMDYYFN